MGYRNIKKQKLLFFSSNWGFWFFNVPGQHILPILQECPLCLCFTFCIWTVVILLYSMQTIVHICKDFPRKVPNPKQWTNLQETNCWLWVNTVESKKAGGHICWGAKRLARLAKWAGRWSWEVRGDLGRWEVILAKSGSEGTLRAIELMGQLLERCF